MTEVPGKAGNFIPRQPKNLDDTKRWANEAARSIKAVLNLSRDERQEVIDKGLLNVQRFNPSLYLNNDETLYNGIIPNYK